ncbi:MAG: hypothetical protein CL908_19105 [Deltaproteobacteria bacterium]|nr:hypothetical protein [Deltaproteobacteria bacterium]
MTRSSDEALTRARHHLRQATLEGLEAARALLEAALQSTSLRGVIDDSLAATLAHSLEDMIAALRASSAFIVPQDLAAPLLRALDAEIAKWEQRSKTDTEARPVLRTFLGLRELLWEFGLRREDEPKAPGSEDPKAPSEPPGRRRQAEAPRVQRFPIEH